MLSALDPEQRQLAEAFIKDKGRATVADQVRSLVLGDGGNYQLIGAELSMMTPAQKASMYDEYTQKYGGNLSSDLLDKIPSEQLQNYQDLLSMTKVSAQSDFAKFLIDNGDLQHGVEDGSGFTAMRASQQYAMALEGANAFHQSLTPEAIANLNLAVGQAAQD